MLAESTPHYVLGPSRLLKLLANRDLRKIEKYIELHARFGHGNTWLAKADAKTRTARLARIGNRWVALYVQVPVNANAGGNYNEPVPSVDTVASGLEDLLAFQAANPHREPTMSGIAERRDRQIRELTLAARR